MTHILSLIKRLYTRFAPQGVLDPNDANHWKEKILYTFIFISVFLIFLMGMINFPDVIKHNYWVIVITITISYMGCLVMFFFPAISYKKRAAMASFLVYAVGVSIIYTVGPILASREWLFSFSIIASVLLGWPGAIFSITVNTITLIGISILIKIGFWKDLLVTPEPLFFWFQIATDLFFINLSTTLFVTLLFQKIEQSDRNAKKNSNLLLSEQVKLTDAKIKLEKEITDRKVAERSMIESERRYRHLFNNAPVGMFEINILTKKFVSVNDVMCKYTGYSKEEFLRLHPLDLLTKESQNLFLKRYELVSKGEKIADNAEYNLIKKNNQKVSAILNNDLAYRNKSLEISQIVVHDITKLKLAEEEKIKAQKVAGEQKKLALVGQIAGKMAHDFNNVLSIIMGNTELSLLDCQESQTKRALNLILEQTLRGKNLTKNLVAFAKSQEPKQESFDIDKKVNLVLNLLKKDIEGIELIIETKPNLPHLIADPGMIEHALVNLIQNSIHATSKIENPKIFIRTYFLDDQINFEIEDNGCGIPKEYVEIIFEPSFTLKGTKDVTGSYERGIKGTGYGMANVKKYIELHKGRISLESRLGSGTKVTINLPIMKQNLSINEKIELLEGIGHSEKSILLVEDEIAISDIQYRILTQDPCNHHVDIANTGTIAVDLFDRNKYDFVSLDYILPGKINGMDVYTHIRKTKKTIPILFISGNIDFLESIKELKQKDDYLDHLAKPCQNIDYIKCINKLLEYKSTVVKG